MKFIHLKDTMIEMPLADGRLYNYLENLKNSHIQNWSALKEAVLVVARNGRFWVQPDFMDCLPPWASVKKQDRAMTDWLIGLFNSAFVDSNVVLVRGYHEPEYLASKDGKPAQIIFAHGYFSSALHEISHWCIAGKQRRQLDDFGYWYCPDGRDEATQKKFEQVEIKPQAIEFLFTSICGLKFVVSVDNLNADFDISDGSFERDIYLQVITYLQNPKTLPKDALYLFGLLSYITGLE